MTEHLAHGTPLGKARFGRSQLDETIMIKAPAVIAIVLGLSLAQNVKACGTIRLWHQQYFEATTDEGRLNALKFLHCTPVVQRYLQQREGTDLLLTIIDHALTLGNHNTQIAAAYRLLAIKNYMVFELFSGSDDMVSHTFLQDQIGKALGWQYFRFDLNFKTSVGLFLPIFQPFQNYETGADYHQTLRRQVDQLKRAYSTE